MTLLEKLCKELGVEVGETWLGNDGYRYCITKSGEVDIFNQHGEFLDYNYVCLAAILKGELKPVSKPKKEEIYYIPDITTPKLYHAMMWMDVEEDIEFYKKGLVFKTKEEAINMARETMRFIREERWNGRD